MTQGLVAWWCSFIGVTDPEAVRIATGVTAAAMAALAFVWIFNSIFAIFGANVTWGPGKTSK